MSGAIFKYEFRDIPCSAVKDTAITFLTLTLADTEGMRLRIRKLVIGSVADAVADEQFLVQIKTIHDGIAGAGTETAIEAAANIRRAHPADANPEAVVKYDFNAAEPTTYEVVADWAIGMNLRGSIIEPFADPDSRPRIYHNSILGLIVTPKTASNARRFSGLLEWEERF